MKLLLFTNLYPSPYEPTRGTFNHQVFRALAHHSEAVRVVSPLPWWTRVRPRPTDLFVAAHDTATGLDASYPVYWTLPRIAPGLHGEAMYASLRGYIGRLRRDFAFDAILAAWAYPDAYAAVRLGRDFGCPVVTNLMGSDINDLAARTGLQKQVVWAMQNSHTVIAVSHALRDRVVEMGVASEKVVVHHNGVNGDRFLLRDRADVRKKLGLSPDSKLILYVGNFRPVKGTDVLIEAMGALAGLRQDTDLLLVGSGELESVLRARADALGVGERVHFCGRKSHDEIPLWISASDVFCLPSRNEGCPNVILEALASGVPVVASRVGGIPELLNAENGVMVQAEDAQALARGLDHALSQCWNPDALRASVEYLSWDDVGRAYHAHLAEAVAATSQRQMRAIPQSG